MVELDLASGLTVNTGLPRVPSDMSDDGSVWLVAGEDDRAAEGFTVNDEVARYSPDGQTVTVFPLPKKSMTLSYLPTV